MDARLFEAAKARTEGFRQMFYPGRGIVFGLGKEAVIQIYWLMGRSAKSQNRRLVTDDHGRVWTEFVVKEKKKEEEKEEEDDPLRLYTAMTQRSGAYIVSNGRQTDAIFNEFSQPTGNFTRCLEDFQHEDDPPIFTPRISAIYSPGTVIWAQASIIGKNSRTGFIAWSPPAPGIGYCLHTYQGGAEDPPLAFSGHPYAILLPEGGPLEMLETFWSWLDEKNRVALAIKFIDTFSGRSHVLIKNKHN